MTAIVDNGFARIGAETLIREYGTPGAVTGDTIAYDSSLTLNEKISTITGEDLTADLVINLPLGNLEATNVQDALDELQTELDASYHKRVETVASSATPASNTDDYDVTKIDALATNITSLSSGLTGTPVDWSLHVWDITPNGTIRTITYGASFEDGDYAWVTTTTATGRLIQLGMWNSTTSKWRRIA